MSADQTVESDEDSVDGIPSRMTYGSRVTFLESVALVNEYADVIDDVGSETFRMKHVELDRSDIHTLRHAGVIEDSGEEWGRLTNWRVSENALEIHRMITTFPGYSYLVLDPEDQWMTLERNAHHLKELDRSTETFQASDYENLSSALIVSLRDAGFIERVGEKRIGDPDTWRLTPDTVSLLQFLFQDDDWL